MKIVAVIPARLESSRFPRKALVDIHGLPMVVHVYKRCMLASRIDFVAVATDSEEIAKAVELSGGNVIMTASSHQTGTDRIAEAAESLDADIIVDVQGDEALVNPQYIDKVVEPLIANPSIDMAILINRFQKKNSPSDIKVVINELNEVMYMSRSDIPSDSRSEGTQQYKAYHIVPYRKDFLLRYASWDPGRLERIEFNEFLRGLEKGYPITAVEVESSAVSVDTEDDLAYVREKMLTDIFFKKYS